MSSKISNFHKTKFFRQTTFLKLFCGCRRRRLTKMSLKTDAYGDDLERRFDVTALASYVGSSDVDDVVDVI